MKTKTDSTVVLDAQTIESGRRRLLLTVRDLGKLASCSPRTVWQARRGERVSFSTARKLAGALGIEATELVAKPPSGQPATRASA